MSELSRIVMSEFCGIYNFQNIVKRPLKYKKNPSKPTCIDPILINVPKSL